MEPFKNVFHPRGIAIMAANLARHDTHFRADDFVAQACHGLEFLELKQRSQQIFQALCDHLPEDFLKSSSLIKKALHPSCTGAPMRAESDDTGIQGWLIMPLAEYAGLRGGAHLPEALALMRELTMRFTAEFGIRHLLKDHPQAALEIMQSWVDDPNEHVRRLVSEGTRPRLPWGLRLHAYLKDPQCTLPLLEKLRDDPSEYVRRSVANHLNDIAKDHPELVLDLAHAWNVGAAAPRKTLLRHALRNLLKHGHTKALSLYQMAEPQLANVSITLPSLRVPRHGNLALRVAFTSTAEVEQRLRLDLVVHYQKANGKLSPKVFLWKEMRLAPGESHVAEKSISFRPITTRTYHLGRHRVECKANGVTLAGEDFELVS